MILEWKDEKTIKPEEANPEEVKAETTAPVDEAAAAGETAAPEAAATGEEPASAEAPTADPAPKPARSPEAAAWEAKQSAQKTGLERPTRPTLAEAPNHTNPQSATAAEAPAKPVQEVPARIGQIEAPLKPAERRAPVVQKPAPHKPSGFERLLQAAQFVAPIVERVLPLLNGNVATAATAATLLLKRPAGPAVDLQPLEDALEKLHTAQGELSDRIDEQSAQLKGVGKRLGSLEELTEQRHAELEEQLQSVRAKVTVLLRLIVLLLVISLTTIGYLVLHALHVLP